VSDPVVAFSDDTDPDEQALLADSVGLALLVVLDEMAPAERIAFVLHDVFGVSHADVATVLDRSEAAAQQLASRARRRVRDSPEPDRDLARQRHVVDAFFAASRDGDFDVLIQVLHPDVVLTIDGGSLRRAASLTLRGAEAVAAHTRTYATLHPFVFPALVNGRAGAVIAPGGQPYAVMAFTTNSEGRILRIDALLDPERLAHLELTIPTIEEGPE
jgi:RNA polymerase sigma-70 factor (ECF subfamily)